MPSDHSVRGHNNQRLFPGGPEPSRKNPEEFIERSNPWPGTLALWHSKFLPMYEVFEQKVPAITEDPEHCSSLDRDDGEHGRSFRSRPVNSNDPGC